MNFEVRVNKPKRLKFARMLTGCTLAFFVWFMNRRAIRERLAQDGGWLVFYVLSAALALTFLFTFYAEQRPRIVVDDLTITFYPRWGRGRTVTLSDITARTAQIDRSDPRSAAVSAALGGGLTGYAAAKALPAAPPAMVYTYFSDRKKLITVTTRDMANVERFDQMAVAHLDCEPLQPVAARTVQKQQQPQAPIPKYAVPAAKKGGSQYDE